MGQTPFVRPCDWRQYHSEQPLGQTDYQAFLEVGSTFNGDSLHFNCKERVGANSKTVWLSAKNVARLHAELGEWLESRNAEGDSSMANPTRIITSSDEEVNRLARKKLGLPDGHPVGFEMLGRPPKKGELFTFGEQKVPKKMDFGFECEGDHGNPCDGGGPCQLHAFRIVALGPDGKPLSAPSAMLMDEVQIKPPRLEELPELTEEQIEHCRNLLRVRVIPPAKQYARIEFNLPSGPVCMWLDEVGEFNSTGLLEADWKLADIPILAEAFQVAHREWAKEES